LEFATAQALFTVGWPGAPRAASATERDGRGGGFGAKFRILALADFALFDPGWQRAKLALEFLLTPKKFLLLALEPAFFGTELG